MSTPAPDATRFGGSLMPASDVSRGQGAPGLRFQPDATFKIDGVVPGIYRLVMGTPNSATAGWTPRSAMLGGRDLLDTTFDVRAGEEISGVVLTYTDRMAGLAGTLVDSADRPAPQFYVFMFPSDRTFWTPGSRRIKSVRADVTGAYDITGLPPGEYYVCALTSLDPTQQNEPAYLEQFIAAAIRIALSDGEQRQQTLRIGG